VRDLNLREVATALPLVLLALGMGLLPQPFLSRLAPSSQRFVARASLGSAASGIRELEMKVRELER